MSNNELEEFRKANEDGNAIGEEIFNLVNERAAEMLDRDVNKHMVDATVRIAVQMAAASVFANMIIQGKGITDDEECKKLAQALHDRISKVISDYFLETGAKLIGVDIS
jgi:hypothetical protein